MCICSQKTNPNPNPQPGEEEAPRQFYNGFLVSEEAYKKAGEGVLKRTCSDGARRNAFKLKQVCLDWILGRNSLL